MGSFDLAASKRAERANKVLASLLFIISKKLRL